MKNTGIFKIIIVIEYLYSITEVSCALDQRQCLSQRVVELRVLEIPGIGTMGGDLGLGLGNKIPDDLFSHILVFSLKME